MISALRHALAVAVLPFTMAVVVPLSGGLLVLAGEALLGLLPAHAPAPAADQTLEPELRAKARQDRLSGTAWGQRPRKEAT